MSNPHCTWTDGDVLDFVSVAFRHVEIKGTLHMQDVRDGMNRMAAVGKMPFAIPADELLVPEPPPPVDAGGYEF